MPPQRLPIVDSDDGVWGDILRQYLMKEHYNDDTDNAVNGGHKTITVRAGTTSAGTAPIKLTSGSLMSSAEVGAIEFLSDDLYFTRTTGTTRDAFVFATRTQTLTNKTLTNPIVNGEIYDTNNKEVLDIISAGAGAVNYMEVRNRATAGNPGLRGVGGDTNVGIDLYGQGTGKVTILDSTDTNKRVAFDVSGVTSGNTRILAVPDASTTIVGTTPTQTLTNKTLTAPILDGTSIIPQTGTLELYNTSDQVTNYEKFVARYNSNILEVGHVYGGTASSRAARFGAGSAAGGTMQRYIQVQSSTPFVSYNWSGTTLTGQAINIGSGNTFTASSGNQTALGIDPTINQTSTAGYTGLLINPTESGTGSGTKTLIDAQVGGAARFSVSNTGNTTVMGTLDIGHASDTTISRTGAGAIAVEGVGVALNTTSQSHTANTIELGNASDTTISRSSAGVIAVEGVTVPLNSTSSVHTASSIELGNASDTTLSRSSAGVLAVEGVIVPTISSNHTLTNKTISGASNTLSNIALSSLSTTGTADNTTYLRGDGQWTAVTSGMSRSFTTTSGGYTAGSAANTDYIYIIAGAHAGALPTANANTNRYTFKNNHSANVTITRDGSDTIEGSTSITLSPGNSVDLVSNGTNTWIII